MKTYTPIQGMHECVNGTGCYVTKAEFDALKAERENLCAFLHARRMHPDFEYATTDGPRKAFDGHQPEGEGWERNTAIGREGWERFDYHEEAYWRRRKRTSTTT